MSESKGVSNKGSNSINDARLDELIKSSGAAASRRSGSAGGSREGNTIASATSGGGTVHRSSRVRPPRDDRSQASSTDAGTPRRISSRSSSDDKSVASHSSSSGARGSHRDHRSGSGKPSSSRRSRRDSVDDKDSTTVDHRGASAVLDSMDCESFFGSEASTSMNSGHPALAFASTTSNTNTDTSPILEPPVADCLAPPRIQFGDARPIWIQDKPITPPPKANPLTGRLIFVVPSSKMDVPMMTMVEWNALTQSPVCSAPLLSPQLLIKLQLKYPSVIATVGKIEQVMQIAVGVHEAHGYTEAWVAVLMSVQVRDYQWRTDVVTIIGIYQWNHGSTNNSSTSCPLLSVLIPPSGGDFAYQADSLLMAESCVFLAGLSTHKGPCVFISQPTVKETWSANFVERTGRITTMAVVHASIHSKERPQRGININAQQQRFPYLAIALLDGTISVWTFEAALKLAIVNKRNNTGTAEPGVARRLLFPVCRLDINSLEIAPIIDWERNTTIGKFRTKTMTSVLIN